MTLPASLVSAPSLDLPGLQIDLLGALRLQYLPLILVLLFFALFDTLGTLMGIAHQAGLLRGRRAAAHRPGATADALGMVGGALSGTSPVTAYIESGSGVGVGARTGLASVVTGALLPALALLHAAGGRDQPAGRRRLHARHGPGADPGGHADGPRRARDRLGGHDGGGQQDLPEVEEQQASAIARIARNASRPSSCLPARASSN